MNTYSLRAECQHDVDELRALVTAACPASEFVISDVFLTHESVRHPVPDRHVEIRTDLAFDDLLALIRSIEDGHVMLQTCEPLPLDENPLERDFDRQ